MGDAEIPAPDKTDAAAKTETTLFVSVRIYAVSAHSWMVPSRVFLAILAILLQLFTRLPVRVPWEDEAALLASALVDGDGVQLGLSSSRSRVEVALDLSFGGRDAVSETATTVITMITMKMQPFLRSIRQKDSQHCNAGQAGSAT